MPLTVPDGSLSVTLVFHDGTSCPTSAHPTGVGEDGFLVYEAVSPRPVQEVAQVQVDVLPAQSTLFVAYAEDLS